MLKDNHFDVCRVLGAFLGNDDFIKQICNGRPCVSDGDACLFTHDNSDSLGPQSKVKIRSGDIFYDEITLEELYYYLNLAYQNYITDGQYPETVKLFAENLEYFRNACGIKGTARKA